MNRVTVRCTIVLGFCAATWMLGANAGFAVESVRANPPFITINAFRPLPIQTTAVTWQLQSFGGVGPQTIGSSGARFQIDSGSVVTVGQAPPLAAQSVPGGPSRPVTLQENLQIPRSVIDEALRRGASRVLFRRTFTNQFINPGSRPDLPGIAGPAVVSVDQTISIVLSTSSTGELVLFGAELRFDAGSPVRIVSAGELVRVAADLSYAGSGELEAVWEIADDGGPSGVPLFRSLRTVRRFLGAGQRVSIKAPEIRSHRAGPHLVRLRIVSPSPQFPAPVARFAVTGPGARQIGEMHWGPFPKRIGGGAALTWQPYPGAAAYRVEALVSESSPDPAEALFTSEHPTYRDRQGAGADVQAFERDVRHDARPLRVVATALTRDARFEPSRAWLAPLPKDRALGWRVVALDSEGRPLGVTPLQWAVRSPQHPGIEP